jgi:FkbM family methyltransferase
MLSDEDIADRIALKALFNKRKDNAETKAGFFYFDDQDLMIAQGQETYVIVARDMAVGYPLFISGESDFSKFLAAISLLREDRGRRIDAMWDVGANIGSVCIPALRRGFVRRAVAFEPQKKLFRLLRANAILNEVDGRLECHNVALGESRGSVDLTIAENNTGDYRIAGRMFEDDSMGEAARGKEAVDVRPMDDFIDRFEADSTLIYMDIQGYEGIALKGASRILSASPPLVAEFWPYGMKRLSSYEAFRGTVCSGLYSEFADLSEQPPQFKPLTAGALDTLHKKIGENSGSFTDLLFV